MPNQKLKKATCFCLFMIGVVGCGEKPQMSIKASPADHTEASSGVAGKTPIVSPQIQVSLSDEDWEKSQSFFYQAILPRIEAMEGAILWLPSGTMVLSAQTDMLIYNTSTVVAQTSVLIENSARLVEKSDALIEKTEVLIDEAQKTRQALEKLIIILTTAPVRR